MATTMENVIAVLVLIAIITSAGSLWYGLTVASDVSTLTDSMADLAGSVSALTASVETLTTSVAGVTTDVSGLATDVAELATSVTGIATAVANLATATEADLAAITGDITAITGDITALTADITALSANMTAATADLADLSLALADIADRVAEIEATLTPTITVVGPWSGAEMDNFLPVLERFEALSGINTKYRVLRAEDLIEILPAQFAAGTAPGDVIFMWGWYIKQQGPAGHVLNVTDLVDEADSLVGVYDQVKVDDTIYGGAYTGKVKPGFWYRKSFFTANGLTPPATNATWAEFLTFLDAINATGVVNPIVSGTGAVGWPLSDITEHFLITFGGPQLQRDLIAGTVDWNSTQVRSIFEDRLVPLLQGYFSDPLPWDSTAINSWWAGDYGLYFMGSWITGMVDDPDDLGIIPLPNSTGLVFVADYFFIPTYTEHSEEAKELFKFLTSAEAQRLQVQVGGHVATNVEVSLDWYPAVDKMVANVTTGKETLLDLDDTIGGEFQSTFFDQLSLLWVDPTKLDEVLAALDAVAP
ncbi:MAG: extracellular solute-binding protein [Candidatus Bathyarchaeia archaeon]